MFDRMDAIRLMVALCLLCLLDLIADLDEIAMLGHEAAGVEGEDSIALVLPDVASGSC
jgi:hypothetical protein